MISLQKPQSGAQQEYLKCSIRGTNNQILKKFYKYVHFQLFNVKYKFAYLQLFNIKYKFVQLQLFDVRFLFSEEDIFRKQKGTVVYGRASLVLGFQLTRENDDPLSLRHKLIFDVPHRVHEYSKMRFPTKGIELTRLKLFKDSRVSQL